MLERFNGSEPYIYIYKNINTIFNFHESEKNVCIKIQSFTMKKIHTFDNNFISTLYQKSDTSGHHTFVLNLCNSVLVIVSAFAITGIMFTLLSNFFMVTKSSAFNLKFQLQELNKVHIDIEKFNSLVWFNPL